MRWSFVRYVVEGIDLATPGVRCRSDREHVYFILVAIGSADVWSSEKNIDRDEHFDFFMEQRSFFSSLVGVSRVVRRLYIYILTTGR